MNLLKKMGKYSLLVLISSVVFIGCSTINNIKNKKSESDILPGKIAFLWSEDNTTGRNLIYIMKLNGEVMTEITPRGIVNSKDLAWSSDGEYLAFDAEVNDTYQIFTIKADGSGLKQITQSDNASFLPSWSPTDEEILFTSSSVQDVDESGKLIPRVYLMRSDGTDIRQIMVQTKNEKSPIVGFFRKDGMISISEQLTRNSDINYVVNINGEIQEEYKEFVTTGGRPQWSPDGNYVIYTDDRADSDCQSISYRKFDGTEDKCIQVGQRIDPPIYVSNVSWSPDGNYFLFYANIEDPQSYSLYAMKKDGSQLQLVPILKGLGEPVWGN
jgi:Tol biopolymer transport system component